jgi:LysM repeat protein
VHGPICSVSPAGRWAPARHAGLRRAGIRLLAALGSACMVMALSARLALADDAVHVVQPGEDLYRIGLHYGVDWRAIMAANGLVSTTIYTGQRLVIPGPAASAAKTPLPAAPTPSPAAAPDGGAALSAAAVPSAAGSAYVIRPGDALLLIAQRFHVSLNSLMTLNGLTDANRVYAGQTLFIPGAAGKWLAVSGRGQALPLDCESRSAVDWAGFFGVRISELEFFRRLPVSDDPDTGFVGSVYGRWGQIPPGPYGVHAAPVAALLQAYGVRAQAQRGLTWDSVRAEIDAGRPVMVWVVGHVSGSAAVSYTAASNGHTTTVAPYEHTVIVTGYSTGAVTLLDGGTVYDRSLAQFITSWSVLGDMAIVATP